MIRLNLELSLSYTVLTPSADFFFYMLAARTAHQCVPYENLRISQADAAWRIEQLGNERCLRLTAVAGPLNVRYTATVEIDHYMAAPETIGETPVNQLPLEVLPYIYPSRYCQSDRLAKLANREFGHLPQGYARVQAIADWVYQHVTFRSNSSSGTTSAVDTLVEGVGVCRDFAHLMIALCRAINLPARFATGTDYGADPALGPPDFHAYVEVYLCGRWYLFDPSGVAIPMGILRLATGRDAADVAFATIFGGVLSEQPQIKIWADQDSQRGWQLPWRTDQALSTDEGGSQPVNGIAPQAPPLD